MSRPIGAPSPIPDRLSWPYYGARECLNTASGIRAEMLLKETPIYDAVALYYNYLIRAFPAAAASVEMYNAEMRASRNAPVQYMGWSAPTAHQLAIEVAAETIDLMHFGLTGVPTGALEQTSGEGISRRADKIRALLSIKGVLKNPNLLLSEMEWEATRAQTARQPLKPRECDEPILAVLRAAGKRLSTAKLLAALEAAGHIFGESTIKGRLAQLVEAGVITNAGDSRGTGYGLPEWNNA